MENADLEKRLNAMEARLVEQEHRTSILVRALSRHEFADPRLSYRAASVLDSIELLEQRMNTGTTQT